MKMMVIAPRSTANSDYSGWWEGGEDGKTIARVASCAIATVAAFAPDDFDVSLLDESVEVFDPDRHGDADLYAITANVGQASGGIRLAQTLRKMGKTVIMGGPHVSLAPELFEAHADAIVVGEMEPVAEAVFEDIRNDSLKPRYDSTKADMLTSPVPRWDLYPNDQAFFGVVQTSRGCPFECHFCDVIQYLGRVQRHKSNAQIIAELQLLYDKGYSHVFLADDNFTVYRKRARSLLEAIAAWNGKEGREYMTLFTQLSIDLSKDLELVELCREAGLVSAFVGIETNNVESLKESKKRQNVKVDLTEEITKIVSKGMRLDGGLIAGFDHDDHSIFESLYDFTRTLPVGYFAVSVLVAPVATPLYDTMLAEGRLVLEDTMSHFAAAPLVTNILPKQMTREELYVGTRWLASKIFNPESFFERFTRISETLQSAPWEVPDAKASRRPARKLQAKLYADLFRQEMRKDPQFADMMRRALKLIKANPHIKDNLGEILGHYTLSLNNRRTFGIYDGEWAKLDAPPFGTDTARQSWIKATSAISQDLEHTKKPVLQAAE
ncbi:MAG: radical SAM protein [Kiloniellales bacterium]